MYKATVRALVRHGLRRLNDGGPSFLVRLAHPKAELAFPGRNSFAAMYRPVVEAVDAHVTHRGTDELRGFADRFVELGLRFEVDDVLVNGGPWRTRVAVRGLVRAPGPPGEPDVYRNRIVAMVTLVWGRMVQWEDYEDTQRAAAWDAARDRAAATASAGDALGTRPATTAPAPASDPALAPR